MEYILEKNSAKMLHNVPRLGVQAGEHLSVLQRSTGTADCKYCKSAVTRVIRVLINKALVYEGYTNFSRFWRLSKPTISHTIPPIARKTRLLTIVSCQIMA